MYWFTADLHLGHEGIVNACKRPYKDVDHMNASLIRNWNARVKEDDIVYHFGDFCFRQIKEQNAKYWEEQLNGTIIHIEGNHDKNNSVKTLLNKVVMEFGGKMILGQHIPPLHPAEIPAWCDFVICGHIHDRWSYRYNYEDINIPVINVGVDVRNFRPLSISEVLKIYDQIIKNGKYNE